MISSAAIHAVVFFGLTPPKEPKLRAIVNDTPTIELQMPNLKDLDEPEQAPAAEETPLDTQSYAPTLADVPQVVTSTDFVQRIDFSSLVDKPDLSQAKVFAVPENISRGTIKPDIGKVFNLADLDRQPEPLVRQPPVFPAEFRKEGIEATVRVQFIVDTTGHVVNAFVVQTTHPGFNEAAVAGVSKWKFRPGVKNGRRVNTRMEVPIVFKVTDEE